LVLLQEVSVVVVEANVCHVDVMPPAVMELVVAEEGTELVQALAVVVVLMLMEKR
jgi:hypothetical protein